MEENQFQGQAAEKETEVYKCPNCGANMVFSPKLQKLYCEHCQTQIDVARREVRPADFLTGREEGESWGEETVVYRCNNCGARQIISKTDIACKCPFCGTTNVVESDELPGLKPNAVIPFSVDEAGAQSAFKAWVKKKFFVPTKLKKQVKADMLNGVYNPCFVYNSDTFSSYTGRLGEYYTVTVGSGKNRHTETRIRYYNVQGTIGMEFRDLMIEASPHFDQKLANKLKPFSYEQAALYDKKFLSGFSASGYDRDIDSCWQDGKKLMDTAIQQAIVRKHCADVVDYLNVETSHHNVTYRYLLMPIWFCNYDYNKKRYQYYINGTTARVVGKVPRSGWKIFRLVGIILGAAAVMLLIGYFL